MIASDYQTVYKRVHDSRIEVFTAAVINWLITTKRLAHGYLRYACTLVILLRPLSSINDIYWNYPYYTTGAEHEAGTAYHSEASVIPLDVLWGKCWSFLVLCVFTLIICLFVYFMATFFSFYIDLRLCIITFVVYYCLSTDTLALILAM
jgi:hypothetical protein